MPRKEISRVVFRSPSRPGVARPAEDAAGSNSHHVFFDNSDQSEVVLSHTAGADRAQRAHPQSAGGCPSNRTVFQDRPNAVRVGSQSAPGGSWDAQIQFVSFPNRCPDFSGGTLFFWVYSPEPITAEDLPNVMMSDARGGLQVATMPGSFTAWSRSRASRATCPPANGYRSAFRSRSCVRRPSTSSHPERMQSLIFHQRRADGKKHVLIVDDVRIDDEPAPDAVAAPLPTPDGVSAKGYDPTSTCNGRRPPRAPPGTSSYPARSTAGLLCPSARNGRASIATPTSSADSASRRATASPPPTGRVASRSRRQR